MGEMKKLLRGLCGLILVVTAGAPVVGADEGPRWVGRMELGGSLFWDGPHIGSSGRPLADWTDQCGNIQCFEFGFVVAERGERLRIALDHPDLRDTFSFTVFDPDGREVTWEQSGSGTGVAVVGNYTREVFVRNPAIGDWTILVRAEHVVDSAFRMRARLEDVVPFPADKLLYPNLRVIPPFELTFKQPTSLVGPGIDKPSRDASCSADETVEHGGLRCLRFSIGPQNVGDGPFEVHYRPLSGSPMSGVIMQRVYRGNGKYVEREAGTYEYHKTHAHYHHSAFGDLRLFRVTDLQRGRLVPAGKGPKQGFCMGPYKIAQWRTFAQDQPGNVERDCSVANGPRGVSMGLERGWADVYSWELPGNYVDFGDNSDGYFVVRVKTDANQDIKETKESDNVGYAFIRVTGNQIEVLERGYGTDPWDPNKKVEADDFLAANG